MWSRCWTRPPYELIRKIGVGTTADDTIWRPFNMTRDSHGNLYVTNIGTCKVLKMDVDGHVLLSFGQQGDAPGMFAPAPGDLPLPTMQA